MEQDRKKIKKEKKRLQTIREMREQRNKRKHNTYFIFPKKRDIRFKDPKEKR
ncbi:hypothetical protein ES702_07502 [subsurface metagenome]